MKMHGTLKRWMICVGGLAVLFVSVGLLLAGYVRPDPADAFDRFCHGEGRAEDQLMDPLLLAGEKIVPLVMEGVEDRSMPRRRYAISFLGHIGAEEAVPMLTAILEDTTELDYIRADALRAIAGIRIDLGKQQSERFADTGGCIGYAAQEVLTGGQESLQKRTYWDALVSRHD